MRQPLEVEVIVPGALVVATGRLDSSSCDVLRTALRDAVAEGEGDLVLQAGGLQIWGAPALGVLLAAGRGARRRDRRLLVRGLAARELRLVRAGHLERHLVVVPEHVEEPVALDSGTWSAAAPGR